MVYVVVMINEKALKAYLREKFRDAQTVDIRKLGEGVQGAGFLVEVKTPAGVAAYVVKGLFPEGLGHDYSSDRAAVFLLDLDEYKNLPRHVRAIDVLAEMDNGTIRSIGGGREYYLLMERGKGRDYFHDLEEFSGKESPGPSDITRIRTMASYLAEIHAEKKESRPLYWRKVRDTIGHGECLMGVFDTYPDGALSYEAMADIEKLCIDWRARLKRKTHRLAQIHGDFHPGNIWFTGDDDFILLDRSRGPWGEPADDVVALAINYIFFSVRHHGDVRGAYLSGLRLFFDEYIRLSGDKELLSVLAPFFAFRAAVVANPLFYPDFSAAGRGMIFNFARSVLLAERFDVELVNDYLRGP
ncbi:MAG: phosphotransferase [Nitrospiraceae bacterium]|nr:phosphotransferase [Nitrospiraceae bacterium]